MTSSIQFFVPDEEGNVTRYSAAVADDDNEVMIWELWKPQFQGKMLRNMETKVPLTNIRQLARELAGQSFEAVDWTDEYADVRQQLDAQRPLTVVCFDVYDNKGGIKTIGVRLEDGDNTPLAVYWKKFDGKMLLVSETNVVPEDINQPLRNFDGMTLDVINWREGYDHVRAALEAY